MTHSEYTSKEGDFCETWYPGDAEGNLTVGPEWVFAWDTAGGNMFLWYDGSGGSYEAQWYPLSDATIAYDSSASQLTWDLPQAQYYYY